MPLEPEPREGLRHELPAPEAFPAQQLCHMSSPTLIVPASSGSVQNITVLLMPTSACYVLNLADYTLLPAALPVFLDYAAECFS